MEDRCKALWSEIPHPKSKQQTIHDVWKKRNCV
jgi:hypothetical protein